MIAGLDSPLSPLREEARAAGLPEGGSPLGRVAGDSVELGQACLLLCFNPSPAPRSSGLPPEARPAARRSRAFALPRLVVCRQTTHFSRSAGVLQWDARWPATLPTPGWIPPPPGGFFIGPRSIGSAEKHFGDHRPGVEGLAAPFGLSPLPSSFARPGWLRCLADTPDPTSDRCWAAPLLC